MTTAMAAPLCSVVIPTFNRRDVLRRCLDALAVQAVAAGTMEIIVADDGSTDGTGAMVSAWAAASTVKLRYFHQANMGANAARNAAIRMSSSRILLIINDDTIAAPGLVIAHLTMHAANPAEPLCVLGRMTISPDLPPSLFAPLHHDGAYKQFAGREELGWTSFYTCNVSLKRNFLVRHGLFDENLRWHEDIELAERLVPHGFRLLYCPEALGFHHHFLTEQDYLAIARREGHALTAWHLKLRAEGRPDNSVVGSALNSAWRHRVADLALGGHNAALALALARRLARLPLPQGPRLATALYAKLFQHLKRETIRAQRHDR